MYAIHNRIPKRVERDQRDLLSVYNVWLSPRSIQYPGQKLQLTNRYRGFANHVYCSSDMEETITTLQLLLKTKLGMHG